MAKWQSVWQSVAFMTNTVQELTFRSKTPSHIDLSGVGLHILHIHYHGCWPTQWIILTPHNESHYYPYHYKIVTQVYVKFQQIFCWYAVVHLTNVTNWCILFNVIMKLLMESCMCLVCGGVLSNIKQKKYPLLPCHFMTIYSFKCLFRTWTASGTYHSDTKTVPLPAHAGSTLVFFYWELDVAAINTLWPSDAIWRYRSGSILAQAMAWCRQAPSHYLNQCWLIISQVLWHSSDGIIMRK